MSYSLPPFTNLLDVTGCGRWEKHLRTVIKEGFQRLKLPSYLYRQVGLFSEAKSLFIMGRSGSSKKRLFPKRRFEESSHKAGQAVPSATERCLLAPEVGESKQ